MALASRASSFRPQKHWRGRPLAVSQNVQQILVAKGDPRLQVLAIFLEHSLTQDIGIKLAGFCKLDNLFSDSFPQNALVAKLKSCDQSILWERIAKKIIELTKTSELNPDVLCEAVFKKYCQHL